jgi:hypothetical protein
MCQYVMGVRESVQSELASCQHSLRARLLMKGLIGDELAAASFLHGPKWDRNAGCKYTVLDKPGLSVIVRARSTSASSSMIIGRLSRTACRQRSDGQGAGPQ